MLRQLSASILALLTVGLFAHAQEATSQGTKPILS